MEWSGGGGGGDEWWGGAAVMSIVDDGVCGGVPALKSKNKHQQYD